MRYSKSVVLLFARRRHHSADGLLFLFSGGDCVYQALYRKWRPKTFDDVAGQEHITTTLRNELKNDRISHAYLFTGSRGTGKTTCAKILAKAVNCLNPKDGSPCGECEICREIDNGTSIDVFEMDAASNRKIDDIRGIIDEVQGTPYKCPRDLYPRDNRGSQDHADDPVALPAVRFSPHSAA